MRKTENQTERQKYRQTEREKERERDIQRKRDGDTNKQKDTYKETERQTGTLPCRHWICRVKASAWCALAKRSSSRRPSVI